MIQESHKQESLLFIVKLAILLMFFEKGPVMVNGRGAAVKGPRDTQRHLPFEAVHRAAKKCNPKGSCQDGDFGDEHPDTSLPSLSPSSVPISPNPTDTPTAATTSSEPSLVPSAEPSLSPTVSPSTIPTTHPTTSPTQPPSLFPSVSPTASPSGHPSVLPSSLPTSTPTTEPRLSLKPSSSPTSSSSSRSSTAPTLNPSTSPTHTPSFTPSYDPSSLSSLSPTTSTMPTVFSNFVDIPQTEGDGFVSLCLDNPEDVDVTSAGTLQISYSVHLTENSDPVRVVSTVHERFRTTFSSYVCGLGASRRRRLSEGPEFRSVAFQPSATVSSSSCPTGSLDGEDCYAANTVFGVTYLGPFVPDVTLVNALEPFFLQEMSDGGQVATSHPNITLMEFRGFVKGDERLFGDPTTVVNEDSTSHKKNNQGFIWPLLISVAILGAVLVTFVVIRRQTRNITGYYKHDEEDSFDKTHHTGEESMP